MIELILRIGFSLLVVLGLMWALARIARRPLGRRTAGGGAALAVLSRTQLSRNAAVAVVKVVDRALIVGITEGQVSLLGETDLAAARRAVEQPVVRRRPVSLDEPMDEPYERRPARPAARPSDGSRDGSLDRSFEPSFVRPAGRPATRPGTAPGPLHGSLLSPATWSQTVDFLRERTARRG
jgi:flagellar protein FliO/FliZ